MRKNTFKLILLCNLWLFLPVVSFAATVRVKIDGIGGSSKIIKADNAMDVLDEYDTEIVSYSFGDYVKCIEGKCSKGTNGWIYLVNCKVPSKAADKYKLNSDDYIIWYYGDFNQQPKCDKANSEIKTSLEKKETYKKNLDYKKYKSSHFVKNKSYYKKMYKRYIQDKNPRYYDSFVIYSNYLKEKLKYKNNGENISVVSANFKKYYLYKAFKDSQDSYLTTIKNINVYQ